MTAEPTSTVNKERKMRRRLYTSNYIGMAGYLMDFGLGGFIGYGKGVSVGLVMEELNRCDKYEVRCGAVDERLRIIAAYIQASPDSVLRELGRGMSRLVGTVH